MQGERRRAQTSAHRLRDDRGSASGRPRFPCPTPGLPAREANRLAMLEPGSVPAGRRFWAGRRVLVTGHTGFKGAWLSLWLTELGAQVSGFARDVPTDPSLYALARVGELVEHVDGDIRDAEARRARRSPRLRPEIVLHLAAQPFVRRSFRDPVETYATNVMGTVNVLDAVRRAAATCASSSSSRSDKCYENREWVWGYRESEPMGGHDPYSSSKGCAELVTARLPRARSSTPPTRPPSPARGPATSSAAATGARTACCPTSSAPRWPARRSASATPSAVRPWQHVLNPLSGYLRAGRARRGTDRARAPGLELRPRRRRRAAGALDRRAPRRAVGRAAALGGSTPARTRTRRSGSSSTPRWPARGWTGRRAGTSPTGWSGPSPGTAPTATAPTSARRRSAQLREFAA